MDSNQKLDSAKETTIELSGHLDEMKYGLRSPVEEEPCLTSASNEKAVFLSFSFEWKFQSWHISDCPSKIFIASSSPLTSEWKIDVDVNGVDADSRDKNKVFVVLSCQSLRFNNENKSIAKFAGQLQLFDTEELLTTKNSGLEKLAVGSRCLFHIPESMKPSIDKARIKISVILDIIDEFNLKYEPFRGIRTDVRKLEEVKSNVTGTKPITEDQTVDIICNGEAIIKSSICVLDEKCKYLMNMIGSDNKIYLLEGDEKIVQQFIEFLNSGTCEIIKGSNMGKKSSLFDLALNCECIPAQSACFESMVECMDLETAPLVAQFAKLCDLDNTPGFEASMQDLKRYFRRNIMELPKSINFMRYYDDYYKYFAGLVMDCPDDNL